MIPFPSNKTKIECLTQENRGAKLGNELEVEIRMRYKKNSLAVVIKSEVIFTYRDDPEIKEVTPRKGIHRFDSDY